MGWGRGEGGWGRVPERLTLRGGGSVGTRGSHREGRELDGLEAGGERQEGDLETGG